MSKTKTTFVEPGSDETQISFGTVTEGDNI